MPSPCGYVPFTKFSNYSNAEIAKIVSNHLSGRNTLVYAYDGTRRSYLMEKVNNSNDSTSMMNDNDCQLINYNEYSKTAIHNLLYQLVMMFEHGIDTIVYPMWFCTLENRGPEYLPKFIQYLWGLSALLENPELVETYQRLGIRVIFYGEFRELLRRGNDEKLLQVFEDIMELTKNNTKKTVLLGTNIDEPSNTLIQETIQFYKIHGCAPTKEDLVKQYYGVNVDDVSMYIGFDRFSTDGRPILISDKGAEDLYWAIAPHSLMNIQSFRKVLHDNVYLRTTTNAKEYELRNEDIQKMKKFYQTNMYTVMGCGDIQSGANIWYPLGSQTLTKNIK